MFLARSIRRKMVFGLALVLVMLVALSASGIFGLIAFRDVVNNLDFSLHQTPHRADLFAAVSLLLKPLLVHTSKSRDHSEFRTAEFPEQLVRTRKRILAYRAKLDRTPPTAGKWVNESLMVEIDEGLDNLERMQVTLADGRTAQPMLREVARLMDLAQGVHDPPAGLNRTLTQARNVYRTAFVLVCVTSTIAVLLFLSLFGCGYRWIFAPIRKLHQGASRVAQGDFDYRVELSTNDEMAELASSFNNMTERFQEIANDLDRQVRERSRQLVRSERLAGVGFLAAGVAHEINNPLTAVKWTSESLEERIVPLLEHLDEEDASVVKQYLRIIQDEAFRCQQITAKLLDFSRGQDAIRGRNDLTAIVNEVLELVGHMSKYRDRTTSFDRTDPCYLEINGPEIKQVVLNLVANALESTEADGTLEIELIEKTDHVIIVLTDDGCGMTADIIDNLFEPFFTKNKTGKGTGLGLSISHRIVSDHGGTIEATSDGPDQGSQFSVHLPRRSAAPEAAA